MKQRQFTVWTCLVTTVLLLAGCLQDKVGGVKMYSEPNVVLYSVSNQSSMFLFYASGPWTATSRVPWLEVTKASGPGGTDTLKVMTTQKNLTGQERRALVELVADGELTTVEVVQRDEYAEFDRDTLKLPAEGGMMEVTFRANTRDSLQLYVTGSLAEFLEDTRKKDTTKATRAEEEFKGTLNFLRVLPNTDTIARSGLFYLAIGIGNERHINLDTLVFHQDALVK
ncbi:MAG: BACON domain-containing protein [Prevotella sp.]|nr:BACON domain-containing protein [Prevotella sp.]